MDKSNASGADLAGLDERAKRRVSLALNLAATMYGAARNARSPHEISLDEERAAMVEDAQGKETLTALLDRSFRSSDPRNAVREIRRTLSERGVPLSFSFWERSGLHLVRLLMLVLPRFCVSVVKSAVRRKTRDVILTGTMGDLVAHTSARRAQGFRLTVNRLGEMILGESEADSKTRDDCRLLERPEIDCISVKASNLYSQVSALAHERSVAMMIERLRPRLRAAMQHRRENGACKLVNLDMEEYRDMSITIDAFRRVLDEPEFLELQVGLAIQAYLPDSHGAVADILEWAKSRRSRGGAPIRIRVVKGANRAMELVESSLRGIECPTYDDKCDADANWKAIVELISRPENIHACHLGIATHNVFDLCWASVLVSERGVEDFCAYEMLEGMANHVAREVQKEIGDVLLYAPAVSSEKFLTAVAYLMRRFDELTDPANFLSHIFAVEPGSETWNELAVGFVESVRRMDTVSKQRCRSQDRGTKPIARDSFVDMDVFRNEPDTDWTALANQKWLRHEVIRLIEYIRESEPVYIGLADTASVSKARRALRVVVDRSHPDSVIACMELASADDVDAALNVALTAGKSWNARTVEERGQLLRAAAHEFRLRRAELMALCALNVGKTFDQSDGEISEAVDFGELYPASVLRLHQEVPRCNISPIGSGVVAVVAPWNFPVAIPAGGVFAALAAGHAVILKPSPESMLVTTRIATCFWAAGVPREALQVLNCDNQVAAALVADSRVAAVVFTGSTATADRILAARPGRPLFAETGGKNATLVTGKADRELAIRHVADSFRNNGQKCSATSLLLLTPELYDDPGFLAQLKDAVESLPVGVAADPASVITPLFRDAGPELFRGFTKLEEGESWLLEPRMVNDRLDFWTPGIRLGTARGSFNHVTELFGPVLDVMRVANLDDAIVVVRETGRGLTLGVETLDDKEFRYVADHADVGVIYGNKSTVGALVMRQTFGGWLDSRRGPGIHAGGPNYVANLMSFSDINQDNSDINHIVHSLQSLEEQWNCRYSGGHRLGSKIRGEDNVHRYRPLGHVTVRVMRGDSPFDALTRITAAALSGNQVTVSSETDCHLVTLVRSLHPPLDGFSLNEIVESDEVLIARLKDEGHVTLRYAAPERVPDIVWDFASKHGRVHVSAEPVVSSGRIELLRYLQEQTVSVAYHRYGGNLRKDDV